MTPTSMAYCHGSMIHVPVKTSNTQMTPGECKSREISLQSNVKANPLSFHHDSSVYHIASLKHSLNSLSWTRSWFLKVSILGTSQKPRQWCCVVFVNSGEQGQQDSISWWSVFGKWKIPTTCKPLTGSMDPLTPSHLDHGGNSTCETAGRTGCPSCSWEMGMSCLHWDQILQSYAPCSDLPSRPWYIGLRVAELLRTFWGTKCHVFLIFVLILFQKDLRNPRDKSSKILLDHWPHT